MNSGRAVTRSSNGSVDARATVKVNSSSEVGSIQCASSNSISTGCCAASRVNCASSASSVFSLRRCGVRSGRGYLSPVGIDIRSAMNPISSAPAFDRASKRFELGQPRFRHVLAAQARGVLELGNEGMERARLMVRRAEIAQPRVRLARRLLQHRLRQTRFADAGFADQHHHPALAGLGLLPAALQQRQFLVAADERGQVSPVQRLEAALGGALAHHPRGRHRRAQALELDGAQIRVLEQTAGQPPRARRDHHRARLGQGLQPRREVRRLADHRLFLRGALADQIADDHQPGGDADPHLQWRRRGGVEPGHRLDQRQPGPHRALGIVLVGPRIAEIGEHAVAHILRDKPAGAFDNRGATSVVDADHRAQVLCVKPRR